MYQGVRNSFDPVQDVYVGPMGLQPWASGIFGETRRAYSAEVASATKAGSISFFPKASEDTRCAQ